MIYDQLGETPAASFGSLEAWASYVQSLRDKISASKQAAVSAYNTLKQVRQDLGLPFSTAQSSEGYADTGAWPEDYEQQAVDVGAMAKVCIEASDDVLSGKRKLLWDDKVEDFAIEGFASDPLRLIYGGQGQPVLVNASGAEAHVQGQVGIAPIAILGIGTLAVVQGVGIYLLVDKALDTLQVVANQKTQKTLAEAAKKHADLVAQGKATSDEAVELNNSIYKGSAALQKEQSEAGRRKEETSDITSAVKTIAWVGLGVGVLYVVAQALKGGVPALAGARDNPINIPRQDLIRGLVKDEQDLASLQRDIRKLERGERVPNLSLYAALQRERGLKQCISNKEKLLQHPKYALRDNPDYTQFRSSYLPAALRDVPPFTPSGTDLEIWTWETERVSPKTGQPYTLFHGIAFAGKAGKPLWHHWFGTAASRMKMIEDSIAGRKAHLKWREERTGARRDFKHTLKVGDVLYTSWGYDQTNVDFYEVTAVKEKSVAVCKISGRVVESKANITYVVPAPGACRGKSEIKRVGEGNSVKIDNHYAYKWEGRPVYETTSGWGH